MRILESWGWSIRLLFCLAFLGLGGPQASAQLRLRGKGPFKAEDSKRIETMLRSAFEARFPEGFDHFRADLLADSKKLATLRIVVERPKGLPGVRTLSLKVDWSDWRETLDGQRPPFLPLTLKTFQLDLASEWVGETLGTQGVSFRLKRVGPRERAVVSKVPSRLSKALEAKGFGPDLEGYPLNKGATGWRFEGNFAPPIGGSGKGFLRPSVGPGGVLFLKLIAATRGNQLLSPSESLILERGLARRLQEAWSQFETRMQGIALIEKAHILPSGGLSLSGLGYGAFDFEVAQIQDEARAWKR